jgi:hypothetical protein
LASPAPASASGSSGCSIDSAAFSSIPSGAIPATWSGRKLGAAFVMRGDFTPRIPCNAAPGEYRQYVRGVFTADGAPVAHMLGPGRPLSPTTFQEDGDVGLGTVYGHRAVPGTKSRFVPDQATGPTFEGEDEPGISGVSGHAVSMNLEFEGALIDTSRSNQVLASSAWSVAGSGRVP